MRLTAPPSRPVSMAVRHRLATTRTGRRRIHGCRRRYVQSTLANPSQKGLKSKAHFAIDVAAKEVNGDGVERLNVFFKRILWERRVSLHDVDDDGSPGNDVALLGVLV